MAGCYFTLNSGKGNPGENRSRPVFGHGEIVSS